MTSVNTPAYTGLVYRAEEAAPQPHLSFRVLETPSLPGRYRVTASVQPVSSPHFKPPVGEISIIPYYLDPTHYMEVLLTNDNLGIWLADGAAPDTNQGWDGLHFLPVNTGIGDVRQVTIDMDLNERRLTVTTGDQTYSLTHDFLRPRDPRIAVRSAGNTFNLLSFDVQELTDD